MSGQADEPYDKRRRTTVRWIVAGLALFGAYVVGRGAGIVLDVSPYVGEAVAITLVVAAMLAARR